MVVALLARGHLLVEGVPGLAKTMAVKTLAQAIGGEFKRIQFTPDLVPADLVGTRIYNQKTGEFTTSLGPVFTNLLLADEINRAPAKVQCALLEVMQERQVTIGHETHAVPGPVPRARDPEPDRDRGHLRAAGGAGRPVHAQGRRRLPHADRGVRDRRADDEPARGASSRCSRPGELVALQQAVDRVYVDPALYEYAVRLSGATRTPRAYGMPDLERYITYGASPRASINLILTARALAYVRGREYVAPAGRARHGPRRHAPPARALVRGPLRRRHERRDPVHDPRPRPAAGRPAPGPCSSSRRRLTRRAARGRSRARARPPAPRLAGRPAPGRRCSRATTGACSGAPGIDLASLREYEPGDDVRRIDWNVTARTTIPHVREYHEDREITAWFLLDLSPSVDFGTVDGRARQADACWSTSRRRSRGC